MSLAQFIQFGTLPCTCEKNDSPAHRVVLTGGPSAGKTEIFEMAKKLFCKHVAFVPEAATMVYSAGLQRGTDKNSIKAAQRKIFQTQKELEKMCESISGLRLSIHDRSSLDGLAYWPDVEINFWEENCSSRTEELDYYHTVVHLRTPGDERGYSLLNNPVRTESVDVALELDEKIFRIWEGHPNRLIVNAKPDFHDKVIETIHIIHNSRIPVQASH